MADLPYFRFHLRDTNGNDTMIMVENVGGDYNIPDQDVVDAIRTALESIDGTTVADVHRVYLANDPV